METSTQDQVNAFKAACKNKRLLLAIEALEKLASSPDADDCEQAEFHALDRTSREAEDALLRITA